MTQLPQLDAWLEFYRSRRDRVAELPHPEHARLDEATRRRIARSIATFQLGESSEGHHLIAAARRFGEDNATPQLAELTELFIREEQFHAALLGVFMDANAIPRLQKQWSDRVFRSLRHLAGFEVAVSVLIVAELIALSYYRALAEATASRSLHAICDLILADERAHVAYESGLLMALRKTRPAWQRRAIRGAHATLYAGSVLVVYLGHREVLRAGGFDARSFWASCWDSFHEFFAMQPLSEPVPSTVA